MLTMRFIGAFFFVSRIQYTHNVSALYRVFGDVRSGAFCFVCSFSSFSCYDVEYARQLNTKIEILRHPSLTLCDIASSHTRNVQ